MTSGASAFALPTGTVTFLLTDVEGSTRLWESAGEAMPVAIARHYEILAEVIDGHGGVRPVEQGEGDSVVAAFSRAREAVAAALDAQRALLAEDWPVGARLLVRVALHTGDAQLRDEGNYFGAAVNRCARLRALGHGGQVLVSGATAELVADHLPDGAKLVDLGVHRLRDLGRPERVFALDHPDLGEGVLPPRPLDGVAASLPVRLTSFVGRRRELAELDALLGSTRLLTLTGSGGCGKTRLALQLAADVLDRFPDGAWWVELAPLADGRLVGAAVAEVLGVRPLPGVTELQAVGVYLASRRALVVLDNCEHLLGACAEAAEMLLLAGPEVVVLATSRAPLGVGGETDWRVPPLSLPAPENSVEVLAGFDAVSLFVERAGKVRSGFALTDANAGPVAQVCGELDGLPLAIELAAARVRMLSVEQIASGVSDRFRLLTGGPRTPSARQQTLRASVDWSHDLLCVDEQVLLRRVAVFAGGFTLDACEQVCAGDAIDGDRVLDLLGSLVDQSLVLAEEPGVEVRYRLLETVRQYGLERLAAAGEGDTVRARHRDAFLALAERAAPELETGRQAELLAALDPEAANLAAAIDYSLGSEPALALRFCAALHRWWWARGRIAEAELAQAGSLDACGEGEPALRARVLSGRALLAMTAGEDEAAQSHATEALALAADVGDRRTAARARLFLGGALQGANPRAGRAELARAAELAQAANDDWSLVWANQMIARTYMYQHDHAQAARANEQVAAMALQLGDPFLVSQRWFAVAWTAVIAGRFADARDAAERMRAALAGVGYPSVEALTDSCLAVIDISQGRAEHALERLQSQLERSLKLGVGFAVPVLVPAIAWAELAAGRFEQARGRLEGLLPLIEGRAAYTSAWALGLLAEARRLLADGAAESTALEAQASGERIGNRLFATRARLTLGRLAAARGDWSAARQHVLAHLDACAEGGHAPYVPACLDALGEVAAGLGSDQDAMRLLAAAERARAQTEVVRIPAEERHWAAIEGRLHEALGDDAYDAARRQGAELSTKDALEWARRARGPRRRPPGGLQSLTPTESRVADLVAEGLTNRQIGERLFVAPDTVKTHLAHIFRKLGVKSRAELSAQAARRTPTS